MLMSSTEKQARRADYERDNADKISRKVSQTLALSRGPLLGSAMY